MSILNCQTCLANFASVNEYDLHKENGICENEMNVGILNTSVLKINNTLNNNSIENVSHDEIKTSKKPFYLLKEIADCGLDLKSIVGRTRRRNSVLESCADKSSLGSVNSIDKNDVGKSKEPIMKNNDVDSNNPNNKENAFIKIPMKIERKSLIVNNMNVEIVNAPSGNDVENKSVEYRTDEDDRKAKKSTKLSFPCKVCPEEFETANQLKTHVFLHNYDSSQNVYSTTTSTIESESVPDNVSTSGASGQTSSTSTERKSKKRQKPHAEFSSPDCVEPASKLFKCDDCLKTFVRISNFKVHRKNYHGISFDRKSSSSKSNVNESINNLKCDQCMKDFPDIHALQIHKTINCVKSILELKEWSSKYLRSHYQYGCAICGLSMKTSKKLEYHKEEMHQEFQMPIKKKASN